ncbi:hypothetical protein NT6N_19710 [Oceaniferula spumae]|uniref:F5/8 type C domain-containing protein n=1 Tax=Oceaniferula spumae TaxID=2979115 RepID=A0AAT9FLY5_9BACT
MNKTIPLILSAALVGSASAAVVTNAVVFNKTPSNWTYEGTVTASQSSTGAGGVASRAIDNNTNGVYNNGSVSHTAANGDPNSWFQVDLGVVRPINEVTLFNRSDCCPERLTNYSILASNDSSFATTVFDSGNQGTAGATATINGIDTVARYVRVQRNALSSPNNAGSVISLAEIHVTGAYQNVALGSSPFQTSTAFNGNAGKAIDGNLAQSYNASTTHTNPNASGAVYWETTFTDLTAINEIALYNRGDCCPDRLSNFRVSIFNGANEVWGANYFEGTGNVAQNAVFSILEDAGGFIGTGDRVRIELIGGVNNTSGSSKVLSLREVEIYGVAVPEPSSTALIGLAGVAFLLRRRK